MAYKSGYRYGHDILQRLIKKIRNRQTFLLFFFSLFYPASCGRKSRNFCSKGNITQRKEGIIVNRLIICFVVTFFVTSLLVTSPANAQGRRAENTEYLVLGAVVISIITLVIVLDSDKDYFVEDDNTFQNVLQNNIKATVDTENEEAWLRFTTNF